ncbi:MBL fold metallo-hydrolase [Methylotenera mobilis]|uniref:Beta-lactamase domain protein n=1 Tax=Methylotenera mobilis (strain JLW8 / ATCC BAA-1282 / DSM 17540) TaxID=583345 RepID=C6WUZ8_METML|nr:MBL fold metallo-hydrolase [Methylotenera mobilis]ACT47747.1 beta-lactamase domain protein [Methylotenera mobilis JLW8]
MELTFLGATGTVTGSKYLLKSGDKQILVDCGLFQGLKQLRLRNWAKLPVNPAQIDAVVLTHAHIDHSGYLPVLVKNGFAGKVYCSEGTADLCKIMLPDSAHLQEEEAEYANRRGFSKHNPALPLYTQEDAENTLKLLMPVSFEQDVDLGDGLTLRLSPNGHILGSAFVRIHDKKTSVLFSGDIGRSNDILMRPPVRIKQADYLLIESTYGNRRHERDDPQVKLAAIINKTVSRKGVLVIPVFAVGRAQELLYYIHLLKASCAIAGDTPVYLNSPMAVDATEIFNLYHGEHRLSAEQCRALFSTAHVVNSIEQSKALNEAKGPMIILSASGMASGGRVVHHLKAFVTNARNTILFVGFQAAGTRGAAMLDGAESIKIHGEYIPVRAHVELISNLSAHADYSEILDWLGGFEAPPKKTFIVHGEPVAADAMRRHIEEKLHWRVVMPEYLQTVQLT